MKDFPSPGAHTEGGFTIVESAIAAMIIAIGIESIFGLNNAGLRLVRNAKSPVPFVTIIGTVVFPPYSQTVVFAIFSRSWHMTC